MKKLLTVSAMALAALTAGAQLSVLERFAPTWDENSSYDAASKTITFGASWSDVGVVFDAPTDMSEYSSFEVTFEPIDFFVCLVIEYEGTKAQVTDIVDGATSISAALNPEHKDKVNAVYLEAGELAAIPSRMVMKSAEFIKPDYTNLLSMLTPLWDPNTTYNKDTHTITFGASWSDVGIELGGADLSDYISLVVKIEPVDYLAVVVIEYANAESAQVVRINPGESEAVVWLEDEYKNAVNKVYIEIDELPGGAPATMKLLSAGFVADGTGGVAIPVADSNFVDVYNTQGVLVRKSAPAAAPLQDLAPGLYIAGGRKYVK